MHLKYQIERSLKASERNAETFHRLLKMVEQLEPNGWTPDTYAEIVKELYRVQMCVVHRSLVLDMKGAMKEIERDDLLKYRNCNDEVDDSFTGNQYGRLLDSLDHALMGHPPRNGT